MRGLRRVIGGRVSGESLGVALLIVAAVVLVVLVVS